MFCISFQLNFYDFELKSQCLSWIMIEQFYMNEIYDSLVTYLLHSKFFQVPTIYKKHLPLNHNADKEHIFPTINIIWVNDYPIWNYNFLFNLSNKSIVFLIVHDNLVPKWLCWARREQHVFKHCLMFVSISWPRTHFVSFLIFLEVYN